MPCDYVYDKNSQEEEERKKAEEEEKRREEQLAELESQLGSGVAKIIKDPVTGAYKIVGGKLPDGMHDSCVLAKLQQRGSFSFRTAIQKANATNVNFVGIHDKSHGR